MNYVRTKTIITREKMEEEIEQWQKEKKREIALLNETELSEEAKDLLVSIKKGLRDIKEGKEGYTVEEVLNYVFEGEIICE